MTSKRNMQPPQVCPKCSKVYETPFCISQPCLQREVLSWTMNPEGGYLTIVEGNKYPLRALPRKEVLDAVALVKRAMIATAQAASKFKLSMLMMVFESKKKLMHELFRWMHQVYYADYGGHLKQPLEHFCPSSQEIIRVFTKISPFPQYTGAVQLLAMVYDSDLAYRFRIQDVLQELDKVALAKNPRKEIVRLIDLSIERELSKELGQQADKARLLRLVTQALMCFPYTRKVIISFFAELDLEKIKMDINDRYWVTERYDYDYGGLTFKERQAWRAQEHEGWTPPVVPITSDVSVDKPRINIQQPNLAFYQLSPDNALIMAEQVKQTVMKNYYEKTAGAHQA